jgi:hypothetical protein
MKTLAIVAALLALPFAACTAMKRWQAEDTDDLLVAAGFTIKSADQPEQLSKLEAMEPLKIVRRVKDGQMLYTYADPYVCKCLFVGTAQQYQEYRRLALQKQIADEQLQAAEAQEAAAMDMEWWWW